jgi:hypothetical protein
VSCFAITRRLADVQQRQRALARDRRALVARERLVEPGGLVLLVAEVLDRFVVQQAVDRARARFLVGLVHLPPVLDAPLGHGQRVRDVADDADERDEGVREVEERPEDPADERDLDQRRHDVEQHEREQRVDAGRAALDRARQAAGLPLEVEAQRQAVQVAERAQRDRSDGPLRDLREHGVAELRERDRRDPQHAVTDDQPERQRDRQMLRVGEQVDHPLEQDRHVDGCELRPGQERERADDTQANGRIARGPKMRRERAQRAPFEALDGFVVAARLGHERMIVSVVDV